MDYGDVTHMHASASTLRMQFITLLRGLSLPKALIAVCYMKKVDFHLLSGRCEKHMFLFACKALIAKLSCYISSVLHWIQSMYHVQDGRVRVRNSYRPRKIYFQLIWNSLQKALKVDTLLALSEFKSQTDSQLVPVSSPTAY